MRSYDKVFIGGSFVPSDGGSLVDVISPHSEEVVGRAPRATTADVDRAVAGARAAFDEGPWSRLGMEERIAYVARFRESYAARYEELCDLLIEEMGVPAWLLRGRHGEVPALDHLLARAREFTTEERMAGTLGNELVLRREPVGVVGAIVPWNRPQIMIIAKAVSALLVGCTVVVKASPETPLDALFMAELFEAAGFPEGVVSVLPADREVGEHLVTHPDVDMIAFTGSSATGRRIASLCGAALKRYTLELGGKSAAIVLDDADLSATVGGLKFASFGNSGQGCALQTRVLASKERYAEVVDALAAMTGGITVGDPAEMTSFVGPLISRRQQARVTDYLTIGESEGARIVVGGAGMPEGIERGWYVRPTVFADATNDMRIAREEIFGPVIAVIPYEDEDDAIRIANDSEYGLAGSVWTADVEHGLDIARRVRTGTYGINWYNIDVGGPFGGFKASGIGREFGPDPFGGFVEHKTVLPPPPPPPS